MKVRAKFTVQRIERALGYVSGKGSAEIQSIVLTPVTSGSDEDKRFWAATPSGQITLGCANADAAVAFELGKSYYVDFSPAE
jgi:hypothetical protein